DAFAHLRNTRAGDLLELTMGVVRRVLAVLELWREVDRLLSGRAEMVELPARTDMAAQVARLIGPGFIAAAGPALDHYARYLKAVRLRAERLSAQVARDRQLLDQIAPVQQAWLDEVAALPPGRPMGARLRDVRWLLEEYRVSLWAQRLGTPVKVSDQRIRTLLDH
ncbi:MAG TPA: DUF3418 domain-containing protein, partial [Marmoricola sp.]|nr:DUF3418 domain-containing protein [Marmoricola sp.]